MRFWSIQTPVLLFFLSVGCGSAGDKDEVGTPPPLSTPDPVVETVDVDADGTPAEDDCDDEDPMSTIVATDGDCDGVLTEDDCDDSDPIATVRAEDEDCDGVPTAQDCDDDDGSMSICWKHLSAGRFYTCGITLEDETLCWGGDEFGETSPPDDVVFETLSAGRDHTCGVTLDGEVVCWGRNDHGQGDPPSETSFTMVTTGDSHTCGITTEGETLCWGKPTSGATEPPEGALFTAIDAGRDTTCGVGTIGDPDGTPGTYCWGVDEYTAGRGVYCGGDGYSYCVGVKTSGSHTCALQFTPVGLPWSGQYTVCKGLNNYDQTADPEIGWVYDLDVGGPNTCRLFKESASAPKGIACTGEGAHGLHDIPDGHEFTSLTMGDRHICALTTEDKAVCWGLNEDGQATQPHAKVD